MWSTSQAKPSRGKARQNQSRAQPPDQASSTRAEAGQLDRCRVGPGRARPGRTWPHSHSQLYYKHTLKHTHTHTILMAANGVQIPVPSSSIPNRPNRPSRRVAPSSSENIVNLCCCSTRRMTFKSANCHWVNEL